MADVLPCAAAKLMLRRAIATRDRALRLKLCCIAVTADSPRRLCDDLVQLEKNSWKESLQSAANIWKL